MEYFDDNEDLALNFIHNLSDKKNVMSSELEKYISDNKHLPGIISSAEVEAQGDIDLGEINTKLLEKIEELTLYIIDLQKQIDELKK